MDAELKHLYRQVAKTVHPDIGGGAQDPFATLRGLLMVEVNAAYEASDAAALRAVLLRWERRHDEWDTDERVPPSANDNIVDGDIQWPDDDQTTRDDVDSRGTPHRSQRRTSRAPAGARRPRSTPSPRFRTIHDAARAGHRAAVLRFLARGVDVNASTSGGATPLHFAARHGRLRLAELLLARGACGGTKDRFGRTALHHASRRAHVALVRLLATRPDVDPNAAATTDRRTPLLEAIMRGHREAALALLDEPRTRPELGDRWQITPAHLAAASGDADLLAALLARGGDPDARDHLGRTPLHYAAAAGHATAVAALLARGAHADVADANGHTPLHTVACDEIAGLSIVGMLLSSGVDVERGDGSGHTALLVAVRTGHRAMVRLLLARGARRQLAGALEMALTHDERHDGEIVELLLAHVDRSVDARAIVNSLLKQADPATCAAQLARLRGRLDPIALGAGILRECSCTYPYLVGARRQLAAVNAMLAAGADPNVADEAAGGETALHRCTHSGKRQIALTLLRHGADPNRADQYGSTPVHVAANSGEDAILAAMLDAGGDARARDKRGRTPLHAACEAILAGRRRRTPSGPPIRVRPSGAEDRLLSLGHLRPVVDLLLARGADVNAVDLSGRTPIDAARQQRRQLELAEYLATCGGRWRRS